MALQVWLPLTKNLSNQGLNNMTFSIDTGSNIILDNNGKIGSGALNSSNEFSVTIPALSSKKVWSFCFWGYVVSSTITSNWTQIARINDGSSNFRVEVCPKTTSNGIYCYSTHNNSGYAISSESISSPNGGYYDQWAHFCLTSDGTTIFKYINGELIGTCSYNGAGAITGTFVLTNNNRIYKNDLRVYDHCLSICELKAISSALVLHYPLNDAYVEGTSNLFSTDLTYHTNWNNSGSATWNWNDNTIPKINNSIIYSISRIDTGNSAIGCGRCNLVAGKTYTASVYVYLSGNTDSNIFYVRSVDTNVSTLKYNNEANPQKWPQNQWIRATATFTPSTAYNNCYICTYLNNANSKRALTCWQIEEKDYTTPYTPNTRNETIVHDCSGYQNNGTIFRALNCIGNSPRYKIGTHFTSSIPSRIMLPSDMSCLSGNNEQTLSCWVRSSGLGSGMTQSGLISLGYGNTLFLNASDYCYRIDNGSGLAAIGANQNPHDGNWHLVTATYKSGVASIYIDGVLKNSVSRTFSNRYINIGGNCIGTEVNNSPVYNLNGDISDIRMYTTALSADDIKELYNTSCIINS